MAKKRYFLLSPNDTPEELWVYSKSIDGAYPTVREEYLPLYCNTCGRFSAMDVIEKVGLPDDLHIPEK